MIPTAIRPHSVSFGDFKLNQHEVTALLKASPSDAEQLKSGRSRALANALYRGSVLLLSGRLEKYIESLVVEAIDSINAASPPVGNVPEALRISQIDQSLVDVWFIFENRRSESITSLRKFVSSYPWFWNDTDPCGKLTGEPLIGNQRFSNPSTEKIRDLFRKFGSKNIIADAIRLDTKPDHGQIKNKVDELIGKRNEIAHTGAVPSLTRQDVIEYIVYSRRLARGVDYAFGLQVETIIGSWPWK